jgi:hypothetical protein
MAMEVEANSAVKYSRRRRRDSGDLSDITDGTFGDTGIDQVKTKVDLFILLPYQGKNFDSFLVTCDDKIQNRP